MSQHRIHSDLHRVPKSMVDPGNAGTIQVAEDLQILEVVTTGAETRTLANPTKQGIRFTLRLLTHGGNLVVTASNGLNSSGNTQATFDAASEMLVLISVQYASGYRWDVLHNVGSVGLA